MYVPEFFAGEKTDGGLSQGHAWVAYNSSKSAVIQMARSMACELGEVGIRVNTLSPGHIWTKWVLPALREMIIQTIHDIG